MKKKPWWDFAKLIVKDYPAMCEELNALRRAREVTEGGTTSKWSFSRPVEAAAVKELPPEKQKMLDAVNTAINLTKVLSAGEIRMRLIASMYWDNPRTLVRAAEDLHISRRTANRFHSAFLNAVGRAYGLDI